MVRAWLPRPRLQLLATLSVAPQTRFGTLQPATNHFQTGAVRVTVLPVVHSSRICVAIRMRVFYMSTILPAL